MLSDLDEDELEDIQSRLYSQIHHSTSEELPVANFYHSATEEPNTSVNFTSPCRYYNGTPNTDKETGNLTDEMPGNHEGDSYYIENLVQNFVQAQNDGTIPMVQENPNVNVQPVFMLDPRSSNVLVCNRLSRRQRNAIKKKEKRLEQLKIWRAANEDAELFRNLSLEDRKKVLKCQKRQRYLQARKERLKNRQNVETPHVDYVMDAYSSDLFLNACEKTIPDDVISLSGSEGSSCVALDEKLELLVVSSDDEVESKTANTQVNIIDTTTESKDDVSVAEDDDDVIIIEPEAAVVIDLETEASLKSQTDSELMKPPSDFEASVSSLSGELVSKSSPNKSSPLSSQGKESISTPESSNDFLDNSVSADQNNFNFSLHGSDFNTSKEFVKPKTSHVVCESESSCSASDISAPIKEVLFNEVDFDTPTKDLFTDLNSFNEYITSRRKLKSSFPSLLTPNEEEFEPVRTKVVINEKTLSDSSSESEYNDSKTILVTKNSKNLPNLSHFEVVDDEAVSTEGSAKKKRKKKRKKGKVDQESVEDDESISEKKSDNDSEHTLTKKKKKRKPDVEAETDDTECNTERKKKKSKTDENDFTLKPTNDDSQDDNALCTSEKKKTKQKKNAKDISFEETASGKSNKKKKCGVPDELEDLNEAPIDTPADVATRKSKKKKKSSTEVTNEPFAVEESAQRVKKKKRDESFDETSNNGEECCIAKVKKKKKTQDSPEDLDEPVDKSPNNGDEDSGVSKVKKKKKTRSASEDLDESLDRSSNNGDEESGVSKVRKKKKTQHSSEELDESADRSSNNGDEESGVSKVKKKKKTRTASENIEESIDATSSNGEEARGALKVKKKKKTRSLSEDLSETVETSNKEDSKKKTQKSKKKKRSTNTLECMNVPAGQINSEQESTPEIDSEEPRSVDQSDINQKANKKKKSDLQDANDQTKLDTDTVNSGVVDEDINRKEDGNCDTENTEEAGTAADDANATVLDGSNMVWNETTVIEVDYVDSDVEILPGPDVECVVLDDSDESESECLNVCEDKSEGENLSDVLSGIDDPDVDPQLVNLETDDGHSTRFSDYWSEDMKKFYNVSWGLANFSVEEIQKGMTNDPNKWKILRFDRKTPRSPRGPRCRRCRQFGHYAGHCDRTGPPKCSLCGNQGHLEPRCPNKLCTQCGRRGPYSTIFCSKCAHLRSYKCTQCHMNGHIESFCPDNWRRYHLTTEEGPVAQCKPPQLKLSKDFWCSGCASNGHLEYECGYYGRSHPPSLPYVINYTDVYGLPKETPSTAPSTSVCNSENNLPLAFTNVSTYREIYSMQHTSRNREIVAGDVQNSEATINSPGLQSVGFTKYIQNTAVSTSNTVFPNSSVPNYNQNILHFNENFDQNIPNFNQNVPSFHQNVPYQNQPDEHFIVINQNEPSAPSCNQFSPNFNPNVPDNKPEGNVDAVNQNDPNVPNNNQNITSSIENEAGISNSPSLVTNPFHLRPGMIRLSTVSGDKWILCLEDSLAEELKCNKQVSLELETTFKIPVEVRSNPPGIVLDGPQEKIIAIRQEIIDFLKIRCKKFSKKTYKLTKLVVDYVSGEKQDPRTHFRDMFANIQDNKLYRELNMILFGQWKLEDGRFYMQVLQTYNEAVETKRSQSCQNHIYVTGAIQYLYGKRRTKNTYMKLIESLNLYDLYCNKPNAFTVKYPGVTILSDGTTRIIFSVSSHRARHFIDTHDGVKFLDNVRLTDNVLIQISCAEKKVVQDAEIEIKGIGLTPWFAHKKVKVYLNDLSYIDPFAKTNAKDLLIHVKNQMDLMLLLNHKHYKNIYKKIVAEEEKNFMEQSDLAKKYLELHAILLGHYKLVDGWKHLKIINHWLFKYRNFTGVLFPETAVDEIKTSFLYIFDVKKKDIDYARLIRSLDKTKEGPLVQPDPETLKSNKETWCSGCSKKGHLEYQCGYYGRSHPPTTPFVINYQELYGVPKTKPITAPSTCTLGNSVPVPITNVSTSRETYEVQENSPATQTTLNLPGQQSVGFTQYFQNTAATSSNTFPSSDLSVKNFSQNIQNLNENFSRRVSNFNQGVSTFNQNVQIFDQNLTNCNQNVPNFTQNVSNLNPNLGNNPSLVKNFPNLNRNISSFNRGEDFIPIDGSFNQNVVSAIKPASGVGMNNIPSLFAKPTYLRPTLQKEYPQEPLRRIKFFLPLAHADVTKLEANMSSLLQLEIEFGIPLNVARTPSPHIEIRGTRDTIHAVRMKIFKLLNGPHKDLLSKQERIDLKRYESTKTILQYISGERQDPRPFFELIQTNSPNASNAYSKLNMILFGQWGLEDGRYHLLVLRGYKEAEERNKFQIRFIKRYHIHKALGYLYADRKSFATYKKLLESLDFNELDRQVSCVNEDVEMLPDGTTRIVYHVPLHRAKHLLEMREGIEFLNLLRDTSKVTIEIDNLVGKLYSGRVLITARKCVPWDILRKIAVYIENLSYTDVFTIGNDVAHFVKIKMKELSKMNPQNLKSIYQQIVKRETNKTIELRVTLAEKFQYIHGILFGRHQLLEGTKHLNIINNWLLKYGKSQCVLSEAVIDEIKTSYLYIFDVNRKNIKYGELISGASKLRHCD